MIPSVSIVVPVYNEEDVVGRFATEAFATVDPEWEFVFVDDGSVDRTPTILADVASKRANVSVVRHPHNRGLGAAIRTGMHTARGRIIVTMDSDLSHPFDVMQQVVAGCERSDATFGSRFVPGGGMIGVPLLRRLVSRVGNLVFRFAYWSRIRDLTTGLRAYKAEVVRDLPLREDGFAIQLEISVHLLAGNARVSEVPLVLVNRAAGESKMKYLRLIPSYASTMARLLGVRWGRGTTRSASLSMPPR